MGSNENNNKDIDIITFFEAQLKRRKKLPNRELWLADLKNIYEALVPYLPVSDTAKKYIYKIILEAQ